MQDSRFRVSTDNNYSWRKDFHQELVACLCTDFAGITRGRAFSEQLLQSKMKTGVGWVPVNQTITAFDDIPACPYWGAHGDLRLVPDPDTEIRVDLELGAPPLHFYLCNILQLDGLPWDLCTRSFLRKTLSGFAEKTGCLVSAAFEQEFVILKNAATRKPGFSYQAGRQGEPFATFFMTALEQARQEPEMFLPEFGENQFEFTCKHDFALKAADNAVITREIAHDVARQLGQMISFSPRTGTEGVGNGVHIHISLLDNKGRQVLYDENSENGLSETGGYFAAGIIKYLPAILAFTAPSVISYQRLVPHKWSAAYTCFGDKNREASLRICPVDRFSGNPVAAQYHFEYRAADATANPYLALAVILLAGLEGIEQKLTVPALVNTDPSELSEAEKERLNIKRLPVTLVEALEIMKNTHPVNTWFSQAFLDSYLAVRYSEIERVKDDDEASLCARYRNIF